jgi:hypothetical protein
MSGPANIPMRARYLNILMLFTRLTASTLVVPAVLAASMLSFPTTCTCGAEYPHEHPLFGIAGHHHGAQRTTTGGPDTEFIRSGIHGITVEASTGASSPTLTATHAAETPLQPLPRPEKPAHISQPSDGVSATPDVPPPRA